MIILLRALLIALTLSVMTVPVLASERVGSLQEAIEEVQRETGGRILAADTVRAGPRELYRIKVLTPDGRVRVITKSSRGGRR